MLVWVLTILVVSLFFWWLLSNSPHEDTPNIQLHSDGKHDVINQLLARCQTLRDYTPINVWGRSGHLQSILYGIVGRFGPVPAYNNKLDKLTALDGSLVSYNLVKPNKHDDNHATILVVPGLASHSENKYIRVFVEHMSSHGYTVAVLNHTGALKSVPLKTPRIFTYGHTEDLELVVNDLRAKDPEGKFVAIGFSLGANILLKYLGEKPERQKNFVYAASLCQGYDIPECAVLMNEWENLRKMYNFGLTTKMLDVIKHHRDVFDRHSSEKNIALNWKKISSAKALHELDTVFTTKVYEKDNVSEFYKENSSSKYMKNIYIPMIVMNTLDDPIIPECLFKYPKTFCASNSNVLFVVPKYGGHLGFFEGGYILPNRISWLDRMLLEVTDLMLDITSKQTSGTSESVKFDI